MLHTHNSDGSDSDYSPSDMAPLGLEEVNTGLLFLALIAAIFFVLGIPGFVIWYFN